MSFNREDGFECEECGKTVGGEPLDFEESRELMKEEGWINRKICGEWMNFCSEECYQKYIRGG